jgi:hypothetical protein
MGAHMICPGPKQCLKTEDMECCMEIQKRLNEIESELMSISTEVFKRVKKDENYKPEPIIVPLKDSK